MSVTNLHEIKSPVLHNCEVEEMEYLSRFPKKLFTCFNG